MKMKGIEDLNFSVGKEIFSIGTSRGDIKVKELKSVNGVSDKELMINILKEINFAVFGEFGLMTNKIAGNILQVEPMTTGFEAYLAKDYFKNADENDMDDEQRALELDYDSFDCYGLEKDGTLCGFAILGNQSDETDEEYNYFGIPEFKLLIYCSKMINPEIKIKLIQWLKGEI